MKQNETFTTKKIVYLSIAVALAFVLTYIEIPIFTPFLKLDFSFSVILIFAYMFGSVEGEIVLLLVETLCLLKTSSGGVGELCNFVLGNVFIVIPSLIYRKKKGLKSVIITLILCSLLATVISFPLNRFFIFPVYSNFLNGISYVDLFNDTIVFLLLFNLIKYLSNSLIAVLLYKRLKLLIFGFNKKTDKVFYSISCEETEKIATDYAKTLKKGDVVLLKGEMGVGKTVFSKGVAKGLDIDAEIVSPTYAYMNDYNGKLYHYDCYRLKSGEEADSLGLTEYFYGNGICLIEWSENISDVLPKDVKIVKIEKTGENERKITL